MILDKDKPQPAKQDPEAPELLELVIRDPKTGKELFTEIVKQKHFSSG